MITDLNRAQPTVPMDRYQLLLSAAESAADALDLLATRWTQYGAFGHMAALAGVIDELRAAVDEACRQPVVEAKP